MSVVGNEDILKALGTVQDPYLHRDLVSLGMIEDLVVEDGRVSFTLVLTTAACPLKAELEANVRAAVTAVPGVREVVFKTTSRMRKPKDPTADRKALPGVAQVIAIGAGKGGVGKSTVAANLAVALSATGARVGLLDADIYGPNLPRMLGASRQPSQRDGKILPVEAWGLKFMSMGLLVEQGEAVVWRGPMLHGAIKSFLHDVDWGELDYLLVDLPPGTGDVQLSLIQQTFVAGAVVGLGTAADRASRMLSEGTERRVAALGERLLEGLSSRVPESRLNGDRARRLASIVNVCFAGVDGEAVLHELDLAGITVSTGSACSAAAAGPSHVLVAIGLRPEDAHASVRFSLGEGIEQADVDRIIAAASETVARLRALAGHAGTGRAARASA